MGSRNFHATLRAGILVTCSERPPLAPGASADRHRGIAARGHESLESYSRICYSHTSQGSHENI
jgi:hypothetical protein